MSTDQDQNIQATETVAQPKANASTASKPTKSQKRKTKKTAAANARKEKESSNTTMLQGLNPHQQLRSKLLGKGFTEEQIDDAMDKMWSRNLAYDDFDAVCDFLRVGGNEQDTPTACRHLSEQTTQSNPEEENTTTSTAASTIAVAMTPPTEGDFVLGFSPVEEEKEGDYDSATSRNASNSQAPSLAAKLKMVAGYENLADAAFALTEWITKAAKAHEAEELCNHERSEALSIIFCRAIECSDQSMFDRAVLPAMLDLIGKLLEKTGVAHGAVSATRKSFEGILRRSRSATLKSDEPTKFAAGASQLVISRIRNAVQESKYAVRDGNELIKKLEDEIQALAPSSSSEHGIVELISKRDMHRTAADKSAEVVKIAVIASNRSRGSKYTHREVELERSQLLVSLLGEGGRVMIGNVREEQNQITQELESLKSGPVGMDKLLSDLEGFKSERAAIGIRMEELRNTLKLLEEQDGVLASKIEKSQQDVMELRHNQTARLEELTIKLTEKNATIVFGDSVDLVVESFQRFDETLEKAFACSVRSGSAKPKDMREIATSKTNVFLVRAKNYFVAEADCVEFLRGRVTGLESDIASTQREVETYAMLDMGETVKQLTKKLEAMRKYIIDDQNVITCLCGEAERMRDELIARVEHFMDATATKLSPVQITVLNEITPCLKRIGVNSDSFNSLLQAKAVDDDAAVTTESVAIDSVADTTVVAAAAATIAPKVAAWGASGETAADAKSIREIQQEELESKDA